MPIEENLTYLQKVALKGEIAFALSTSSHDAEIKYRTYLILKEVDEKFKPLIIECIKEAVTLDEDVIDRIYLEVVNNTVPVWLWIDEIIADLKLPLKFADASSAVALGSKLSIDKVKERKNLIESAFIMFAREATMISPTAVEQLIERILNDYDLDFLESACFYLQDCIKEVRALRKEGTEIPEELMSCSFDIKRILNFAIETKALSELNKAERKINKRYQKITKQPLPTEDATESFVMNMDSTITHEQLSQYISEKIAELFEGSPINTAKVTPADTVYVVKKVFTDSGISTNIRVCRTEEEAVDFIKKIVKECPELMNVCEFQVHTERKNDKKDKWKPKDS